MPRSMCAFSSHEENFLGGVSLWPHPAVYPRGVRLRRALVHGQHVREAVLEIILDAVTWRGHVPRVARMTPSSEIILNGQERRRALYEAAIRLF